MRGDNVDDVLVIPLDLHGAWSCFETFKPKVLSCFETFNPTNLTPVTGTSLRMKAHNMTPPSIHLASKKLA
jgi:hypothetical protein